MIIEVYSHKMINLENQRTLLLTIAERIPKKMIIYAIGGTAMMLLGLKRETLDVDLVFSSEKERLMFKDIAFSLGYTETENHYYKRKEILRKLCDSKSTCIPPKPLTLEEMERNKYDLR